MTKEAGSEVLKTNHYTVLGLLAPHDAKSTSYSVDDIRHAYRQALLINHPDKVKLDTAQRGSSGVSIDQIVAAHECLTDPEQRQTYDHQLLQKQKLRHQNSSQISALESFDLEELEYDQDTTSWTKACRCGGRYQVTESQLEQSASQGEVIVNCTSCSLYVLVKFVAI